jgi:hypothetical protein
MSTQKITSLWEWFAKNEQKIKDAIDRGSAFEREYIVESLNDLVLDLGMFSWEIGPGQEQAWSFTLSPNGDRKRMLQSRKIIDQAPPLLGWEFHYSKPAKAWDRSFQLYDDFMVERTIDASDWHFVVSVQEDLIHILLETPELIRLDPDTVQTAAELVIINEIGEEAKILHVGAIEVVPQLDASLREARVEIAFLKRWVEELIRRRNGGRVAGEGR